MKNILRTLACATAMIFGSVNSQAAVVTWTLSDVAFDWDGFQTFFLSGNFDYDATTNMFSNVTLSAKGESICCWEAGITTATSNSTSLDFYTVGFDGNTAHLSLAAPLTDAGGSIALTSGNFLGTLRSGQFITAPVTAAVPEPASWALMIGGFALAGTVMRHRRNAARAAIV